MLQVNILLVTSARTPARIKEGWYMYTISCRGESRTGKETLTNTTGNRLAMHALIAALERMIHPARLRILTDSHYLINGFQQLQLWEQAGFRTLKGAPVKNEDLWQRIYELKGEHEITWQQEEVKTSM